MKNRTIKKIAVLALSLLLLVSVFAGCGSKQTSASLTISSTITQADGGQMSAEQIKSVAEMLQSVYNQKTNNVQDQLIAASRGYDMLAEGFDDAAASPTENGSADPIATAKKVISEAKTAAKDSLKVDDATFANMNEADLANLISVFKTEADTTATSGFLDSIQCWIGSALSWITHTLGFGSYIVGICIFAVIIEILMLPLAIKQQKNSIKQAKLRPKEKAIRDRYKGRNDQATQQKVTQEIQELYQRENFSPYSGCLPLLLQFPILIALYNIVINPLHYVLGQSTSISTALTSYYTAARAAGGMGATLNSSRSTIELLANVGNLEGFKGISNFAYFSNGNSIWESLNAVQSIPNFNILGQNFGLTPSFEKPSILLLVPVLTFAVYFFSMKLTRKFTYQPTQGDVTDKQVACSNTIMDVSMPLMSTFFAFMVPAIVGVYWIFRSVIGTLKQFIMSRVMPLPTFTEEDYKAAAREMAGKKPKSVEKSVNAGAVRSLHHIDDEDFDDTRDAALARKAAIEAREAEERAKKAKKSPFEESSIKDDKNDVTKEN